MVRAWAKAVRETADVGERLRAVVGLGQDVRKLIEPRVRVPERLDWSVPTRPAFGEEDWSVLEGLLDTEVPAWLEESLLESSGDRRNVLSFAVEVFVPLLVRDGLPEEVERVAQCVSDTSAWYP